MRKISLKIFLLIVGFYAIYAIGNNFTNLSNFVTDINLFNITKVEAKYHSNGPCTPYIVASATIEKPTPARYQVESGTVEGPATYKNGAYYNSSNQVVLRINATLEREGTGNPGSSCAGFVDGSSGFTVSPTSLSVGSNVNITVSWKYCINAGYGCGIQTVTETLGPFNIQAASQPPPTTPPPAPPPATKPAVQITSSSTFCSACLTEMNFSFNYQNINWVKIYRSDNGGSEILDGSWTVPIPGDITLSNPVYEGHTYIYRLVAGDNNGNTATASFTANQPYCEPKPNIWAKDVNGIQGDLALLIDYNNPANIFWNSGLVNQNNRMASCLVSPPGWTDLENSTGRSTGNLTTDQTYTLSCDNYAKTCPKSDSVIIKIKPPLPGDFTLNTAPNCDANNPTIKLDWTASSNASGYFIYRSDSTNPLGSVDNKTLTYTDSNNLLEEEGYSYYIKAYNLAGTKKSNLLTVATKNCSGYSLVATPKCTETTPNLAKVDLSWTVKDKPDLFILYRNKGTTASTANPIKTLLNSDLSYIDLDVDKNTDYAYLLRAYYNNGVKDKTKVIKTEVCPEIPVVKKPTVDLKANDSDGPITVPYNTSAILTWTSTNATSCEAQGSWSGNKVLDSSLLTAKGESTGNLTTEKVYALVCIGADGQNSDSVIVKVGVQQTTPQTIIEYDSNIVKYPPPGFGDLIAPNWAEKVP